MGARDSQDGRTLGRTGSGRAWYHQWPRLDRRAVLAVSISLLTLLSVVAVPVAGANTGVANGAASVDVDAGAPAPLANAGQAGDAGGAKSSGNENGGSNGNAGGDSDEDTDEDSEDDNGQSNGNGQANGNDGGNGQANGNDGGNGQANGNDGGNGQANGNDGGNGQANGNGNEPTSSPPGRTSVGAGSSGVDVDVGSLGTLSGFGAPNAGGEGPQADAGPPDNSNAGGNGDGGNGPPADAGPSENSNAGGNGPPDDAGPPDNSNSGGNGTSVSVTAGPPEDLGQDRAEAASSAPAPSSVVSVSVQGARAGDHLDLDVSSTEAENDDVAFEGISVTVKRGGDFTMQVTNSREALPGSPAFEPEQAAESLGRIRLDHSITNDEVEEVSYTFRVSKGHLRGTDTDPEDVALFRYADGEWSELPTDVVGETKTHYLLEADSPGMSEFAVGAKRPDFETFWADVDAASVEAGETVTVRGRVTNDGGADGVYDARLVVDGQTVSTRSITIAAGGTRQINFRTELDRSGAKRISINGVAAGEVSVEEQPVESNADPEEPALTLVIDRLLDVSHALGITTPT